MLKLLLASCALFMLAGPSARAQIEPITNASPSAASEFEAPPPTWPLNAQGQLEVHVRWNTLTAGQLAPGQEVLVLKEDKTAPEGYVVYERWSFPGTGLANGSDGKARWKGIGANYYPADAPTRRYRICIKTRYYVPGPFGPQLATAEDATGWMTIVAP